MRSTLPPVVKELNDKGIKATVTVRPPYSGIPLRQRWMDAWLAEHNNRGNYRQQRRDNPMGAVEAPGLHNDPFRCLASMLPEALALVNRYTEPFHLL